MANVETASQSAKRSQKVPDSHPIIRVRDIWVSFSDHAVLKGLDLDVKRGEILGFVGASGGGKSVLMRTIIGLVRKQKGTIEVFGHDVDKLSEDELQAIERRWGVLFQHGALFSSLTVRQNIQFPLREYLDLSDRLMDEIAIAKLEMVGLPAFVAEKYPSQLSGGMIKRAALARALVLDPEIVFLDEPTSGLDPISAGEFAKKDQDASKKPDRFRPLTRDYVIRFFGQPNNGVGDFQGGLQEHLYLNNGQLGSLFVSSPESLLDMTLQPDTPWEDRVERLFLQTLNRPPRDEEREKVIAFLTSDKDARERVRDTIWALITCSEFRFNH